jgi:hypothetical protein
MTIGARGSFSTAAISRVGYDFLRSVGSIRAASPAALPRPRFGRGFSKCAAFATSDPALASNAKSCSSSAGVQGRPVGRGPSFIWLSLSAPALQAGGSNKSATPGNLSQGKPQCVCPATSAKVVRFRALGNSVDAVRLQPELDQVAVLPRKAKRSVGRRALEAQ